MASVSLKYFHNVLYIIPVISSEQRQYTRNPQAKEREQHKYKDSDSTIQISLKYASHKSLLCHLEINSDEIRAGISATANVWVDRFQNTDEI